MPLALLIAGVAVHLLLAGLAPRRWPGQAWPSRRSPRGFQPTLGVAIPLPVIRSDAIA